MFSVSEEIDASVFRAFTENVDRRLLLKVGIKLPDYTASHPGR
jgi:hypothetical protein